MKRWSAMMAPAGATAEDAAGRQRWQKWFWAFFAIYFVSMLLFSRTIGNPMTPPPAQPPYESPIRIMGWPLIAYGAEAKGIIAIGGRATGVIAIGGLAFGLIAIGGLAVGGITLSGLTVGILAFGGGALGWWAMGGCAVGYYAFGGLAVGGYAYAGGGVALGYFEASGGQHERLLA